MEILVQKVPQTETGLLRKGILKEGIKEIQDFLSMEPPHEPTEKLLSFQFS